MRKSERLRLLELQTLRLEMELDMVKSLLSALLEAGGYPNPDMEAGKWYRRKAD